MAEWWNSQKIKSMKMIFGWIYESLIPQKFPAILYNQMTHTHTQYHNVHVHKPHGLLI